MVSDGSNAGPPPPSERRPSQPPQQTSGEQPPPPQEQPAPAPPPGARSGPAGAGLGRRVGARLLDVLIVAIPLSLVLSLVGWGLGGTRGQITGLLVSLLWFSYFVWFESSRGATVGKNILGIQVVGPQGGPPTTEQAMKRNAWMLLGLIPFIGGLLWLAAVIGIMITIASGSDMQGLHDQWADTAVLRS